jgi:hypothetical protein
MVRNSSKRSPTALTPPGVVAAASASAIVSTTSPSTTTTTTTNSVLPSVNPSVSSISTRRGAAAALQTGGVSTTTTPTSTASTPTASPTRIGTRSRNKPSTSNPTIDVLLSSDGRITEKVKAVSHAKKTPSQQIEILITDPIKGIQQFTCPNCLIVVKLDLERKPSEHQCEDMNDLKFLPRKRIRGFPPYQYPNESAVRVHKTRGGGGAGRKTGTSSQFDEKHDQEREAWLQREIVNKVYDKDALWCRYCGCEQASGFSRGPWVSFPSFYDGPL